MTATEDHTPQLFDIAVIGAGVVGAALARQLSATQLRVALVEARSDVCEATSKANTAILHTGFDAKPGTLEARLVREGYHLLSQFCLDTGVRFEKRGAVLVAWNDEQLEALPGLKAKAEQNEYPETYIVDAQQVYEMLPSLGPGVRGGLCVPGESIIDAWSVPLALATDAVRRGCAFLPDHQVNAVSVGADHTVLHTSAGDIAAKWVVNAAGLGGDTLDQLYGYDRIHLNPRRGELLVYDKLTHAMVPKIVLPVPTKLGKGVLVSPTIFGNTMLGPTAEDMEDRQDTATTEAGFEFLLEKGEALIPALLKEEVTAAYAGLRAASDLADYLIDVDHTQRYVIVGGIRSTGLTSAMAIGEHVAGLLAEAGVDTQARAELPSPPQMPNLGENFPRPYQDQELIAKDPDYGTMVCFCERVTKGEIRDALASTIPPAELTGLRRRTRAGNGRCQAFFCGGELSRLLREAKQEASK